MRSLITMIVAVALLSSMGCHHMWSHGVCDCENDNLCFTRTPWPIAPQATVTPAGEPIAPPVNKLPDGKKL
jgi:hypothetical protein